MSIKYNTDPDKKSLQLDEKTDEETGNETESDSDDDIFDGMTNANAENMRSQISAMATRFSVQVEKRGKDELQLIKQVFKISCDAADLTDEEVKFSIDFCKRHDMNIKNMIEREGFSFLQLMREMMKDDPEAKQTRTRSCKSDSSGVKNVEEKAKDSADEDYSPEKVVKTKRRRVRAAVKNEPDVKAKKKTGYNLDGSKRAGRILLDDALKTKDTNMTGWSDARKKAYKSISGNPNAYHYRFNKPGEPNGKGPWTKQEHKQFMQLLLEKGANKSWGLFSIGIPGRVGYQCSNYYRLLVKNIKIWDPNYWFDGRKLHFKRDTERSEAYMKFAFTVLEDASRVFGKPPVQHPKRPSGLESPEEVVRIASKGFPVEPPKGFNIKRQTTDTQRKSRKRKARKTPLPRKRPRTSNDSDAYVTSVAVVDADPGGGFALPKFVDPFTKCKIITPAISPYGHVCEYDMWTKVLRTPGAKEVCPFTRKSVTRRELVKITPDNLEEFMTKIINQDHAMKEWRESRVV